LFVLVVVCLVLFSLVAAAFLANKDVYCVCEKKNSNFLYFPSKIGYADFAWILHSSTPRRNHIFWAAFEYH